MTVRHTSIDELYNSIGAVITRATGRAWWRKGGVQARTKLPYATLYLQQADTLEKPIVENLYLPDRGPDGEIYEQIPWCTSLINVEIAFYGDRANDSSSNAASRMRSALYLEARNWDLNLIMALSGRVQQIDLSVIFREDVESRTELRFQILANIVEPAPLADTLIYEISSQEVGITHTTLDEEITEIAVIVTDDESS